MKTLSENRRAKFDYEILEKYEAGIKLSGYEVKSAKAGRFNIKGSYAVIRNEELWLINSEIPPYQPSNTPDSYDPKRSRKILMQKKEIKKLIGLLNRKSITLIPLKTYIKNNLVKIELGLAKSRKKADKREIIKKRDIEREIRKSVF